MKLKKLLALLLAFLMVISMAACSANSSTEEEPTAEEAPATEAAEEEGAEAEPAEAASVVETLKVGTTTAPTAFTSGMTWGNSQFICLVFDFLIYNDPVNGGKTSNILDSWDWQDDTTLVMKVKEGITFSNGEKLTGEDILYTFKSYELKGSPYFNMFTAYDLENSYTEDDGMTVYLKFKTVYGPGIEAMYVPILCKSWCEELNDWESDEWYNNPVGSGPYVVDEFVSGASVSFTRRDDYTGPDTCEVKNIVCTYYAEPSTMYMDLESGNIDLAIGLSINDYDRIAEGVEGLACDTTAGGNILLLALNQLHNQYTANETIRQAIAIGVDWDTVAEAQFGSLCVDAPTCVVSSNEYFNAGVADYEYDPDTAKQLLADAGINAGDMSFSMTFLANMEDFADAMKYYLDDLGITFNIEYGDMSVLMAGDAEVKEDRWTYQDTSAYAGEAYPYLLTQTKDGSVFGTYYIDDATFTDLVNEIGQTTDKTKKAELYNELQEYVSEHYILIPICETVAGIGYNTDVISATHLISNSDGCFVNLCEFVGQ